MISTQLEQKFLKQISEDDQLRTRLEACKSPEQALQVIKKAGYDVSLKDFTSRMTELNDFLKENKGELTDNDLQNVAGGRGDAGLQVLTSTMAAGIIGAAAAGAT